MSHKILLVDVTDTAGDTVKDGFVQMGYDVSSNLHSMMAIESHLKLDKHIQYVVVSMTAPTDTYFNELAKVTNNASVPVVVFAETSSRKYTEKAAAIGLSAYIVNGFVPSRIKHIMDLAMARFHEFQTIKKELEKTRLSLAERKIIEKAKGILMRRRTIDEEAAFRMMRKMAMDKNLKLAEVAKNIINVDTLFT
ncbi:ANTAR domain-containing response regulator [Kaarinaea lacus]